MLEYQKQIVLLTFFCVLLVTVLVLSFIARKEWKKNPSKRKFQFFCIAIILFLCFSFSVIAIIYSIGLVQGTMNDKKTSTIGPYPIELKNHLKTFQDASQFLKNFAASNTCNIVAHNAYSCPQNGFMINFQQNSLIFDQLTKYSARGIELDIYLSPAKEVVISHGKPASSVMNVQNPLQRFGISFTDQLNQIVQFLQLDSGGTEKFLTLKQAQNFIWELENNPDSILTETEYEKLYELVRRPPIVYILLEDYVKDGEKVDEAITKSGLADFTSRKNITNSISDQITQGKVVHFFTDSPKAPLKSQYLSYQFFYLKNKFAESITVNDKIPQNTCDGKIRGGFDNPLYGGTPFLLTHYHPMISLFIDYSLLNKKLSSYVSYCRKNMWKNSGIENALPNFILLDHVDKGDTFETAVKIMVDDNIRLFLTNPISILTNINGEKFISGKFTTASLPHLIKN